VAPSAPLHVSPSAAADILARFLADPPPDIPDAVLAALYSAAEPGGEVPYGALFREVVEQTPMAVSITDRKANILYANRAFEQLTGYPRSEVIGHNESLLSNKATPLEIYAELWQTISGKRAWHGVLVNRRKSGEPYLAELSVSPVLDSAGEISHFLGLHRDISEVHRLERQSTYQRELLETVLDAAPVMVALVDTEQRVILENAAYRRLRDDFGGEEPFELFRRGLEEQTKIDLKEQCALRAPFRNQEVRVDSAGGQPRWFSCSGAWACGLEDRVVDYFGNGELPKPCLLLLADEVTLRKRELEQARIEHLRASLAEEQLNAGMREALAAALFQMQGPLNVIEAALGMLESGVSNPEMLRPMLHEILSAGRRTVDTLRAAVPEAEPVAEEPVNLNEVLHEVLQLSTGRLLAGGIVLDWQPEPVLPTVVGNKRQLRSLFNCLIDNAILAVEESRKPHREIRLVTRLHGDIVNAEVSDNGNGIPAENRLRVFEPFFSAWRRRRRKHAGMGLSLAQEIALRHGGGIQIDESQHDGCRVCVELPIRPLGA